MSLSKFFSNRSNFNRSNLKLLWEMRQMVLDEFGVKLNIGDARILDDIRIYVEKSDNPEMRKKLKTLTCLLVESMKSNRDAALEVGFDKGTQQKRKEYLRMYRGQIIK